MTDLISIEEQIATHAKMHPHKIAVIHKKDRVSYQELWGHILAAAQYYQQVRKFVPGTVVILAADKQVEFVYAYFGAHVAGLRVVPLDVATNIKRLSFIISRLHPALLVGFRHTDNLGVEVCSFKEFDLPACNNPVAHPKMGDIADILFTTGTTGEPKGVPLTYHNLAAAARQINTFIKNSSDDVELLALPISHSFGLGRLRCVLSLGATICLLGSFVNVKKLFRTMEEEHITGFTMVPASWRYLKKYTGNKIGEFADQLKYIEMGSAYFSAPEKKELADLMPKTRICMHYGLTEASRSAFLEFHCADRDGHLDSVGRPSPSTEIAIFNEQGKRIGSNQEGEICVKGEHVTKGYLQIPREKTFFEEDFFRTGDWGYLTKDGYLYLVGRKKELINVGGKKVSPLEVEVEIDKFPGIIDCACVAEPDPQGILGEVVKAYLVKDSDCGKIDFADIQSFLFDKLEGYKIPALWDWIDEIPKTHNGKVQRLLLK